MSVGGHLDDQLVAGRAASLPEREPVTAADGIDIRTVRSDDSSEYRAYMRRFWDIQVGLDPGFERRTDDYIDNWIAGVRGRETERNAHNGIALHDGRIVGVYVVRAHDAFGRLTAHVAGLWVHDDYRRRGIAARLREQAEAWARQIGARHLEANVHVHNTRMLELSRRAGFEVVKVTIRKGLG